MVVYGLCAELLGCWSVLWRGNQGFQGYGLSILRIGYLVRERLFLFVVFSRLAILRIGGCTKSTLLTVISEPPRQPLQADR